MKTKTIDMKTIREIVEEYIPKEYISSEMIDKLNNHNNKRVIEDVPEDVSIFGKIGTSQYKELIEGYQNNTGEEFNKWYSNLNKEEKVFLSNLFD